MIHFPKGMALTSTISALVLGAAFMAGCTISTTPVDPSLTPDAAVPVETDGGAGGDSAVSPVVTGGCDYAEPNDTRETASPIQLNTLYKSLCVSSPDHSDELDFFEVTAPAADLAGGVIEVQLSSVKNGGLGEIIVTSSLDNGVVFDGYTTDEGANVSGWFTATPGAKYKVRISRFGGAGKRFEYDLFAKYTAIKDTFEPNNKKEDAKSIAVNTTIEGTSAAHSANADLAVGDDADWYKVNLAAGAATIKMSNVASDHLCDVQLFDAAGDKVGEKYETTPGADCTLAVADLAGGSYYVQLNKFGGLPIRAAANKPVAAFVLQSYKLIAQQ